MLNVWLDIEGYEGLYKVNSIGEILSVKRNIKLSCRTNASGYRIINLSNNKDRKTFSIHQLVAKSFIPNPLNRVFVNHKNGIKNDNRVENLEWCTASENQIHAVAMGLIKNRVKGECVNTAKYNSELVLQISNDKDFKGYRSLAQKYNVSISTAFRIKKNITWKHLFTNQPLMQKEELI